MSKYTIWDKQTPILTPIGEVLSAEKWIERYPIAGLDSITVVCGGGEINGSFFGTLGQMVEIYSKQGCDFSACETAEDKLAAIEAFEDAMNAPSTEPTAEERTATALEAIAAGQTTENASALDALLGEEE